MTHRSCSSSFSQCRRSGLRPQTIYSNHLRGEWKPSSTTPFRAVKGNPPQARHISRPIPPISVVIVAIITSPREKTRGGSFSDPPDLKRCNSSLARCVGSSFQRTRKQLGIFSELGDDVGRQRVRDGAHGLLQQLQVCLYGVRREEVLDVARTLAVEVQDVDG